MHPSGCTAMDCLVTRENNPLSAAGLPHFPFSAFLSFTNILTLPWSLEAEQFCTPFIMPPNWKINDIISESYIGNISWNARSLDNKTPHIDRIDTTDLVTPIIYCMPGVFVLISVTFMIDSLAGKQTTNQSLPFSHTDRTSLTRVMWNPLIDVLGGIFIINSGVCRLSIPSTLQRLPRQIGFGAEPVAKRRVAEFYSAILMSMPQPIHQNSSK